RRGDHHDDGVALHHRSIDVGGQRRCLTIVGGVGWRRLLGGVLAGLIVVGPVVVVASGSTAGRSDRAGAPRLVVVCRRRLVGGVVARRIGLVLGGGLGGRAVRGRAVGG